MFSNQQISAKTRIVTFFIALIVGLSCSMTVLPVTVNADTTTTKTSTSTKVTNSKVKMKKAAKKSKKVTKINTKKYSTQVVTNTTEKKVTKQKTVKTTTVTTYTKKSRYKKIKKTVKTTIKTTTTIKDKPKVTINDLRKAVPANALSAFDKLGFTTVIDPNANANGVFSITKRTITLRNADVDVYLHEMGHFILRMKTSSSKMAELKEIYNAEKEKYTGKNKNYVTSTAEEYYAQSYRDYVREPAKLKAERPRTYEFVKADATNITDVDVQRMINMYSWMWE